MLKFSPLFKCLATVVLTVQTIVNCASLERVHSVTLSLPSGTTRSCAPDEFLKRYGYFKEDHGRSHDTRKSRKEAISLYQVKNRLLVTGKMNRQTWKLMRQPRCGNPDIGEMTSHVKARTKRTVLTKSARVDSSNFKWTSKTVTWGPKRFLSKMSVDKQWQALKKAFEVWSDPSLLTLTYTPLNADIVVGFWSKEHGDGYANAFDGRGQLLAHAFPPGEEPLSGDIHFDADEPWSYGLRSEKTKDLLMVAVHEVGHALGLNHSLIKKDMMYPVYEEFTESPTLSKNDVKRLQSLYGRNPSFKWKPPVKPPAPATTLLTPTAMPSWCDIPFNDVMRGPYGYGYIFSGANVYRFDSKGVSAGYPVHVNKVFPGAPINPLAVVHAREGMHTYFFKGKMLWRFSGFTLDAGYPKRLDPEPPEQPRAAINMLDRKGRDNVYIFGTKFFWQWNPDKEDTSSNYRHINTFWRGLPPVIDAAAHWSDGFIYFFRHNKYYKVSPHTYKVKEGYPKVKGPAWLQGDCGYAPK